MTLRGASINKDPFIIGGVVASTITEVKLLHSLKAFSQILVTLLGMEIDSKLRQL